VDLFGIGQLVIKMFEVVYMVDVVVEVAERMFVELVELV